MAYTTINKSSEHFNTKLYAGNDGTNAITGVGFQPDFNWIKDRTSTGEHLLVDVVRGMYNIRSNSDVAQSANGSIHQQSLDSDGFTVAGSAGNSNASGRNYASWNWKANGAGSANTDGTISSTVSANTTSGFSIVSYTGTGSTTTVGHGLGVAPSMIIVKKINNSGGFVSWHKSLSGGSGGYIYLNSSSAAGTTSNYWGSTVPSSTTFGVWSSGGDNNANGDNFIAYCFVEKKGFSKFGSYTGNGNADGPFVYTGFKPAMVIAKRTDSTGNWRIRDNRRPAYNVIDKVLRPNTSEAEITEDNHDFLSNGFKVRTTGPENNASGGTFIYMAFAEAPLVGTNGVTAKAR